VTRSWPLIAMGLLLGSPTLAIAQETAMRAAAEQGNANAQYKLGEAYYDGAGVPQDRQQALRWFRAAADQGHAEAQYSLGFIYQLGRGVPADGAEAIAWYQKAAAQGHARAASSLKSMQSAAPAKKPAAAPTEGFGGKASTPEQMQARSKLLASIPDGETIVFQPQGKEFSVYTIFVDPECGHCATLFKETSELTKEGIKVRYVPTFDTDLARRIWCSADRRAALKTAFEAADHGKALLPKCASSFSTRFARTAQSLGVDATPTTFTNHGRVLVGYLPVVSMLFEIDESYIYLMEELYKAK
jgi:hypothetical protein